MRVVALSLALLALGCSKKSDAERLASRFVDLYYVEIDQKRALDITAGRARVELEQQLALVGTSRGGEGQRPRTYYSVVSRRQEGEVATFVFDLDTKMGREHGVKRHAIIGVARRDGRWKVTSFGEQEGPAPRRPD